MPLAQKRNYPVKPKAVYFFGTCLLDTLAASAGLAAVELLESQGVEVIYPQGQTCCGQPAFNSGYRKEAQSVAADQIRLFPKDIPVVVPSGSCSAMMYHHYRQLFQAGAENPKDLPPEEVLRFSERVFEWSDFMVNALAVSLKDQGPSIRATYHPSCHLLREMNVREAPLSLLGQLSQVELLELPNAEDCCGFGGTFAVKQDHISGAMVTDKVENVAETNADVLISADMGCLINIGGAMARRGMKTRAVPLALFLKERTLDI